MTALMGTEMAELPEPVYHGKPDLSHVMHRIEALRVMNQDTQMDKWRFRAIMNGGAEGMYAVMAWDQGKGSSGRQISRTLGVDLPTVNLVVSGLERIAQQIGRPPTLKAPDADDETVRTRNQKRVELVRGWDEMTRMELTYPQVGRWLPGYAYSQWNIRSRKIGGQLVPVAELADPYDIYPGWFGVDQQPDECFTERTVPLHAVEEAFPEFDWDKFEAYLKQSRHHATVMASFNPSYDMRLRTWEGPNTGLQICEYQNGYGKFVVIPELEVQLAYIPNVLDSGPQFTFAKRFSFDREQSQFYHVIGLMAMMAKLNILGLIAAEDSTFRETNIAGELESGTYERGRFATNFFTQGTRIEKPVGDQQAQIWAQIDRLERQLRIGSAYDVAQDGQSPMSFATGAGIDELRGSLSANIREYQTVLRHAMEMNDAKRLEYDQKTYGSRKRKYYDMYGKEQTYRPSKLIKGDYRTRRVYGAMATFDDAQKIVAGLQLLQAGIIDVETLQENIDGLENLPLINERIAAKTAEEVLYAILQQETELGPAAKAALVEIMRDPSKKTGILEKYFAPKEPMLSPEEQQMMGQLGGGMAPQGPPPDVTSVLSRLEQGGGAEGGVQTVGQL